MLALDSRSTTGASSTAEDRARAARRGRRNARTEALPEKLTFMKPQKSYRILLMVGYSHYLPYESPAMTQAKAEGKVLAHPEGKMTEAQKRKKALQEAMIPPQIFVGECSHTCNPSSWDPSIL